MVVRVLLCSGQGVAIQSLRCFGWLLGSFYSVISMLWLIECCYSVIKVFWVVVRELLCSY